MDAAADWYFRLQESPRDPELRDALQDWLETDPLHPQAWALAQKAWALTGEAARLWLSEREDALKGIAATLRTTPEDAPARVSALSDQVRKLERELADAKKALALGGGGGSAPAGPEEIGGTQFIGQIIEGLDPKELRGLIDENKKQLGSGVSAIIAVNDGRASVATGVTDDLTGRFNAVDLVRAGVEALGGKGGGGRPDMAQGGGPDGAQAQPALDAIRALIGG